MIIAESGTAWAHSNEDVRGQNVMRFMHWAAYAGADYFKVQMFVPNEPLFCPLPGDDVRWDRWGNSILNVHQWLTIKKMCEKSGIGFMASAFQHTTVEWLNQLGVDYHKVASRAVETYPYDKVKGRVIISTGMGWPTMLRARDEKILQCVSQYPTPLADSRFDNEMPCDGLSDHSGTPWPAIDALARGAEIVEVHFKLDDDGPDAASSVTVDELKMICDFQKALKEMR